MIDKEKLATFLSARPALKYTVLETEAVIPPRALRYFKTSNNISRAHLVALTPVLKKYGYREDCSGICKVKKESHIY